jgi:hypothetical protein
LVPFCSVSTMKEEIKDKKLKKRKFPCVFFLKKYLNF